MVLGRFGSPLVLLVAGGALSGGLLASWTGREELADGVWIAATVVGAFFLTVATLRDLRAGRAGVDLIALLALVASLLLGEHLAGAVIAAMLATGRVLEDRAERRARRELTALLGRAPKAAHRREGDDVLAVPVDAIRRDDRLVVKVGEIVPVDGVLLSPTAVVDEAALTGESLPIERRAGETLRSGCANAGDPFEMRATTTAEDSSYAAVVRMVEQAHAARSPFVRLADRWALVFVPVALTVAGLAWLLSGEPVRALAVLVVATPCPLILAAPVAIVSGISRAARRGVLIKGGGALETLGRAEVLLLDKTGTLTTGLPRVTGIETVDAAAGEEEMLRLAASLDQVSQHVIALAIVAEARRRGLGLSFPEDVVERAGAGLSGVVDGRRVAIGHAAWTARFAGDHDAAAGIMRKIGITGGTGVFVVVDGRLLGAILLADEIRLDTPKALRNLRRAGVKRVLMVSGDRQEVADAIALYLGIDVVLAERSPEEKLDAVLSEKEAGVTVMVGDGINDAPALAAADIGVAMGARGAAAAFEAADVVLLVDRLDRLADALTMARATRRIALQSVGLGMGLSVVAMGAAAAGLLTPVLGALVQELIDVLAILWALRALGVGSRFASATLPREMVESLTSEHREILSFLPRIEALADDLDRLPPAPARERCRAVADFVAGTLVPHERSDEETLYPMLAEKLGGEDPMGSLSRTHREIHHLCRLYVSIVEDLPEVGPGVEDRRELRRVLYSLHAILRLHFAQEEELFATMVADDVRRTRRSWRRGRTGAMP